MTQNFEQIKMIAIAINNLVSYSILTIHSCPMPSKKHWSKMIMSVHFNSVIHIESWILWRYYRSGNHSPSDRLLIHPVIWICKENWSWSLHMRPVSITMMKSPGYHGIVALMRVKSTKSSVGAVGKQMWDVRSRKRRIAAMQRTWYTGRSNKQLIFCICRRKVRSFKYWCRHGRNSDDFLSSV